MSGLGHFRVPDDQARRLQELAAHARHKAEPAIEFRRSVFGMTKAAGLSTSELAEATGLPEADVRSILSDGE